jgi:hypothetical protein
VVERMLGSRRPSPRRVTTVEILPIENDFWRFYRLVT